MERSSYRLHYLTDCSGFSRAVESSLLVASSFAEPPERVPLLKRRWLMQIFIQDVLLRLDELKSRITSVFGRNSKLIQRKKMVKKLAGRPTKTALWCTNVWNEYGQILTSVMTSGEGHGLTPMLKGVIQTDSQQLRSQLQRSSMLIEIVVDLHPYSKC